MNKICIFLLSFFNLFITVNGQNLDSLGKAAITHAAHHNIKALRPVYKEMGEHMPHFIKLYCDIAIASSEGRYERVVECIDSLKQWYPKKLYGNTLLSLAELKAESLRQLGEYEELKEHCAKEIKYFERRKYKKRSLKELYFYQDKASRLLGNGTRAQLLQAADRKDIFKLDSLLSRNIDKLDEFAQLRSRIVLAHSFRQYGTLAACAKGLVVNYADSLDAKELTYCIETYADLLVEDGNWKDLKLWTDEVGTIERGHSANLKYYRHLSMTLAKERPFSLTVPDCDYAIRTTYEWPLLIRASINRTNETDFCLETEQAHTLISQELARNSGATILPDTIAIASANGFVEVSPTFVKELSIGNIKYNNLLVYTVLAEDETAMPIAASLGTNEITRLGKLTFFPEKMVVHHENLAKDANRENGNLYMSEQNGVRIRSYYKNQMQPLSIDLGYPHNVLSQICFSESLSDDAPVEIETSKGTLQIAHPTYIEEKLARCSGILGIAFLRSYQQVTMDFNLMSLDVEEATTYCPARGEFGHDTDKFYLQRNKQALLTDELIDEEEIDFLELLLNIGKNKPENIVKISKQLRERKSPFYDSYTEAEGLFLNEQYKQAVNILENVLAGKYPFTQLSPSEKKVLESVLRSYKLFEKCVPLRISGTNRLSTLEKSDEGHVEVIANGKKKEASIDIFHPYTEISAKYAKKYKIQTLGTANGITHGLIPLLEIGDIQIENVHCILLNNKTGKSKDALPDKGKGIRIGWDLLRHFKQMSYSKDSITLSLDKAVTKKKRAPLYKLKEWRIQTESTEGFPTYILDPKEQVAVFPESLTIGTYRYKASDFNKVSKIKATNAQGKISIKNLLSKAKVITFDLENMELF